MHAYTHIYSIYADLVYDPAAQHLQPLAVEEDLQLEGRLREGEVVVAPPHLHVPEQVPCQACK